MVNHAEYAEFTCTLNCNKDYISTIVWMVGHPAHIVLKDSAADFALKSGLHTEIHSMSSCDQPEKTHSEKIRINATQPEQFNRTAIQCFVFGSANGRRLYSRSSMMFIKPILTGISPHT